MVQYKGVEIEWSGHFPEGKDILISCDPGHGFDGGNFYLLVGPEVIRLDAEIVAKLVGDLNKAACDGGDWPIYEISDR
jgi:hypothetical protein